MSDLFGGTEPADADGYQKTAKLMQAPNGYELAARTLLKQPDTWEAYSWKVLRRDVLGLTEIVGAIPVRIKKTGRRVWPKGPGQTVVVSDEECAAALLAWERVHNACAGCGGDGRVLAGYRQELGYRYRPCDICGGTGKPCRGEV